MKYQPQQHYLQQLFQGYCPLNGSHIARKIVCLPCGHHLNIYAAISLYMVIDTMTQARYHNGLEVIERWDTVFKAISAEPRRQLIIALLDAPPDETVPLPESAVNPNVPRDPTALRQELHHCHLPLLADLGFITWDVGPLVAGRGPRFDEVGIVFESLQSNAANIPEPLVFGCQRLEAEQQKRLDDSPAE
jgi:hypothetical protein